MDMEKDPLFRGEFTVVKELLEKYPAMNTAKNQCDKLIDLNGPKSTGGTGIKQLRENIAESKLSYEIMDDAAQAFLKSKIQDNITKYYMLIVFTGYLNDIEAPKPNTAEEDIKLSKSFADFMKDNGEIAIMIQKGKGKLKWERDVPADIQVKMEYLIIKIPSLLTTFQLNSKTSKYMSSFVVRKNLRRWLPQTSMGI